jgi:hypothetical protein
LFVKKKVVKRKEIQKQNMISLFCHLYYVEVMTCISNKFSIESRGCRGRGRKVVGFTTTYAIRARGTTLCDKVCQ